MQTTTAFFLRCWLLVMLAVLVAGAARADALTDVLLPDKAAKSGTGTERVIASGKTASDDEQIAERLRAIYAEVDELNRVAVSVSGGVVDLAGEVDSAANEAKAVRFATQVEGVVDVQNRLTINRSLRPRLAATWAKIVASGTAIVAALPLFLFAIGVLMVFWLAGRWLATRQALFRHVAPNYFIAKLLGQLVQLVAFVIGLVLALVLLDATALIGTILGAAGIVGLAVGFAVRDTVENYIASILLSIRNPFEVNDTVDIEGHVGNVVKLTSRATILLSSDGNHVRIPNARVFKAVIINYTRRPERRFEFDVGIDTDQDLAAAQTLAQRTLDAVTGVLDDPAPMVIVEALGDSNVVLRCYGWTDQRRHGFPKVRSEAIRAVKHAFDHAGIVMPEPVYVVRLTGTPSIGAVAADATPPTEPPAAKPITQAPPQTADVSVDRTIMQKVAEEEAAAGEENLLSPERDSEL